MKFFQGGRCNATLGGACYIHLTTRTNVYYKQILPCIQMFPLKRLPTIGSPMRSFLFIHTLNIISLHDTFMQYIFSFVMIFEMSSINCKFFSKIFSAYFTTNMHFHIHHICFCPTTPNPPVTAGFFL